MKFQRQSREELSINLTPLIDVVFLLLIFFMVSTTFNRETELKVDLPEAQGEPVELVEETVEVLIDAEGKYSVNGQPLVNSQQKTLSKAILEVSSGNTKRPLIVTADAASPHQSFVTVMEVAGRLGFAHLSVTAQEPSEDQQGAGE